jgi:hypothetical protein
VEDVGGGGGGGEARVLAGVVRGRVVAGQLVVVGREGWAAGVAGPLVMTTRLHARRLWVADISPRGSGDLCGLAEAAPHRAIFILALVLESPYGYRHVRLLCLGLARRARTRHQLIQDFVKWAVVTNLGRKTI